MTAFVVTRPVRSEPYLEPVLLAVGLCEGQKLSGSQQSIRERIQRTLHEGFGVEVSRNAVSSALWHLRHQGRLHYSASYSRDMYNRVHTYWIKL